MAGFIDPSAPSMYYKEPGNSGSSMSSKTFELSIRCSKLSDCDYISKSDPVAIIFEKSKTGSQEWIEKWRSEMILNDLNPHWKKTFVYEYRFGETENDPLKIEIYDWDSNDKGKVYLPI